MLCPISTHDQLAQVYGIGFRMVGGESSRGATENPISTWIQNTTAKVSPALLQPFLVLYFLEVVCRVGTI